MFLLNLLAAFWANFWGGEEEEDWQEQWDREISIKKIEKEKRGKIKTVIKFKTVEGVEKIEIRNKKGVRGIMYLDLVDRILESGIIYVPECD